MDSQAAKDNPHQQENACEDYEEEEKGPAVSEDVIVQEKDWVGIIWRTIEIVWKPCAGMAQVSRVAEHLQVTAPGETIEEGVAVESWGRRGQVEGSQGEVPQCEEDKQVISLVIKFLSQKDHCGYEQQNSKGSSIHVQIAGLIVDDVYGGDSFRGIAVDWVPQ